MSTSGGTPEPNWTSTAVHRGDVVWYEAPLPRRVHRCTAHTRGYIGADYVERCACGAIGRGRGVWLGKNSRRRNRR